MQGLELRVLGGFAARRDGEPIARSAWTRPTAARLIRCLMACGDQAVHGEELCDHLWPQLTSEGARRSIHVAVHYARAVLGPQRIEHYDGTYRLIIAENDSVDCWRFETAARDALRRNRKNAMREALALWTGEPFVEDRAAAWAKAPRTRLVDLQSELVARLGRAR